MCWQMHGWALSNTVLQSLDETQCCHMQQSHSDATTECMHSTSVEFQKCHQGVSCKCREKFVVKIEMARTCWQDGCTLGHRKTKPQVLRCKISRRNCAEDPWSKIMGKQHTKCFSSRNHAALEIAGKTLKDTAASEMLMMTKISRMNLHETIEFEQNHSIPTKTVKKKVFLGKD